MAETLCVPRAGEPGGTCSGQGPCLISADNATAVCLCNYPFANIGDFATDPSVDCGIHFLATRGLWGVDAVVYACLLAVVLRFVVMTRRYKRGMSYIEKVSTLLSISMSVSFLIVGSLEASASFPGQRSIGIDVVTTVFFVIGSFSFWLMSNVYNTEVIRVTIKQTTFFASQKQSHLKVLQNLQIWLHINNISCFLGCFIVLGFLGRVKTLDQVFASLHYLTLGLALVGNAFVLKFALEPMVKQIDVALLSITNDRNKKKLMIARENFMVQNNRAVNPIGFHMSVAILFGAVPVLTRKSAYWLPIAWLAAVFVIYPIFNNWTKSKLHGAKETDADDTKGTVVSTSNEKHDSTYGKNPSTSAVKQVSPSSQHEEIVTREI